MVATIIHGSDDKVAKQKKWTNLRPFRGDRPAAPFRPWFVHEQEEDLSPEVSVNVISDSNKMKIFKYIRHEMAVSDKDDTAQVDRLC